MESRSRELFESDGAAVDFKGDCALGFAVVN